MSGRRGGRSKEETWGEKELGKYIGTTGSPKAQPKVKRDSKHPSGRTSEKQTSSPLAAKRTDSKMMRDKSRTDASKTDRRTTSDKSRTDVSKTDRRTTSDKSRTDTSRVNTHEKGSTESGRNREDARDQRKLDTKGSSGSKTKASHDSGRQSRDARQRNTGKQPSHTGDARQRDTGKQPSRAGDSRRRDAHDSGKQQPSDTGDARGRGTKNRDKQPSDTRVARGRGKDSQELRGEPDEHLGQDELHSTSGSSVQKTGATPSASERDREMEEGDPSEEMAEGVGTLQPMVEVTEEIEEDVYKDDEFEQDYDEDFEEDLESTGSEEETTPIDHAHQGPVDLTVIVQAIDAENELVEGREERQRVEGGPQQPSDLASSPLVPSVGGRRSLVDFSAAQKREKIEKVATKTRKRGQELLSMIELDLVGYDMFDLPPLSEYELYIKNFGSEDARQVSVQTGEDSTETETQTDEVPLTEKWVQWPPEDIKGYGGPGEELDSEELLLAPLSGQSALRLVSFLKRASQVCSVLLEENLCHGQVPFQSSKSPFPFCTNYLTIQIPPFLEGRHATTVQLCSTQDHLILATYSQSISVGEDLERRGVVCLWTVREPSRPQQVLVCESVPLCCCFSPQKTSLVFAGNEDGSVVLWDLREPLSMHRSQRSKVTDKLRITPRVPTFSTAGIPNLDSHLSPIISITPLAVEASEEQHSLLNPSEGEDGTSGLSFQLTTLDRNGQLNIWVIVEIYHPDPHGSESDFGLVPGGKVKLVKSATIDVCRPNPRSAVNTTQARCLQFHPSDTNHLYIGTDTGNIYHHTRYGRRPIPKYYLPNSGGGETGGVHVTSLSFSPWQPDHFLSGSSDGTIRLYQTKRGVPRVDWSQSTGGVGIRHVQWSNHRPGVFLVVDDQSNLYLWDLLKNDAVPLYKQQLGTSVTHCIFSPHTNSSHARPPIILLALTTGNIELHSLDTASQTNSEKLFQDYLDNII